jgi:hypothetical protein
MKTALLLAIAATLAACDRAPANVQTLQTTDCGVTWVVIKAGQRIPTTTGNRCAYNSVLPDYPMQGDMEFKAQFAGNVLVTMRISYDYRITEPIKFIGEAKFLGRMAGTANEAAQGMAGIEQAENSVIDKRVREAATSRTVTQNIVDFNPAKFEEELTAGSNKDLEARGVKIDTMTLVIIPEDQTRQAIDAATAMNVYKSKGLEELGQRLAVARAGAPHITINNVGKDK